MIAAVLVSGPAPHSSSSTAAAPEAIVFVAAAAGSLVALAMIWLLPGRLPHGGTGGVVVRPKLGHAATRMLRTPGFAPAVFVSLAVSSGVDMLIVYLPAYGEATGLSVTTVGGLLAVRAAATLVSRAFMGQMTERFGLGATLVLTTGIAAVCVALLPVPIPVPLLFVLVALIGFGLGIGQPLTVALIGLQSRPDERGLAFGVRHTGNLATLVLVPIAMGSIANVSGIGAVWPVLAGLLAAATLVASRSRFGRIHGG
jgi:MFS family permease